MLSQTVVFPSEVRPCSFDKLYQMVPFTKLKMMKIISWYFKYIRIKYRWGQHILYFINKYILYKLYWWHLHLLNLINNSKLLEFSNYAWWSRAWWRWKHTSKVSKSKTMNIWMFNIKINHSIVMLDFGITSKSLTEATAVKPYSVLQCG